MNARFSVLDVDIDTNTHTYGVFLGNIMLISKKTPNKASFDKCLLRVEYNVVTGFDLEILGITIL
ncbi:hypothetical protein S140_182 [Shewanella sp. phage 1/40]|uniref:hypothetical protein n=1 Tax=Shewanella phage 1/4 TaxID=1458859 RepID=UPI0004F59519|nr:hypothetical protein S14_178 [Shewanella sp. phage 1/4]YP_009104180.1 hypothetical protein S140_182 [Shewanella sp. phage 1/40]AHK11287.1 hypothetical protein S14_178 [Shewanella sp. phage 1/4]AHK11589.1 hypothetical protein S140_182 [Shewanella sp. phage 1/40]